MLDIVSEYCCIEFDLKVNFICDAIWLLCLVQISDYWDILNICLRRVYLLLKFQFRHLKISYFTEFNSFRNCKFLTMFIYQIFDLVFSFPISLVNIFSFIFNQISPILTISPILNLLPYPNLIFLYCLESILITYQIV